MGIRRVRSASTQWLVVALIVAASALFVADAGARTFGEEKVSVEPMTHPLPAGEKPPPGWIAIEKVSNGCGGGILVALQNWIGDDAKFHDGNPFDPAFKVDFREACNLHDAAYSGALVWDSINNKFTDFRGMTQKEADDKLQTDMDKLCEAKIPAQWEKTLANCKAGAAHWIFVRTFGRLTFRERIDFSGAWENKSRGWPMCDAVLARPWTIMQKGRTVTATWQEEQGNTTLFGRFEGVLVSGDKVGDDRVEGTFKIAGGPKLVEGPMTLTVTSADSFDFSDSGARMARTTQSASAAVNGPLRCGFKPAPATTPTATTSTQASTPAPAAGTFVLDTSLTKVSNPNAVELTITPTAAGQGIDDHTGANGGAGNGGDWKVEYHWAVPTRLVPGKTAAIYLQIIVDSEQPPQPNGYQMSALAPDFAQALPCHYPEQSSCSKTFEYAIHADQAGSSQIGVSVHMLSAEVDFTYRPAGK